jgi:hypothetical protein
MRDGFGHRTAGESLSLLHDLRETNDRISRILDRLPSVSREEIAELSGLVKMQGDLINQSPRFHSAEERFETDKEKFIAMHLMQKGIKVLRNRRLRNRGAQPGDRCG